MTTGWLSMRATTPTSPERYLKVEKKTTIEKKTIKTDNKATFRNKDHTSNPMMVFFRTTLLYECPYCWEYMFTLHTW